MYLPTEGHGLSPVTVTVPHPGQGQGHQGERKTGGTALAGEDTAGTDHSKTDL